MATKAAARVFFIYFTLQRFFYKCFKSVRIFV